MKQVDLEFILDVLMEKQSKGNNINWYSVLGFLELNKISGYFYNKTKELQIKLPQGVERKLSQILKLQTLKNKIMRWHIQKLSDRLKNEKLKYVFLKGSVLSNANLNLSELMFSCYDSNSPTTLRLYGEKRFTFYKEGERISNDIDILIVQKDIFTITKILKEMGFKQGYYNFKEQKLVELSRQEILSRRMNRGETAPFILQIDNEILPFIEVDVNFSLDYLPNSNSEMLNKILEDTVDFSGKIKNGIKSLSVQDFFLHLIMHQYKESILYSMVERSKDVEIYKLLDIYLFIKRGIVDLNELYYSIKKYSLEKDIYYVLNELNEIFEDIELSGFLNSIKPIDISYINEVIDPQNKKKYMWKNTIKERILHFDKLQYLEEIKND